MRPADHHDAVGAASTRLRALVALVVAFVRELYVRLRPWPTIDPRPYPCAECRVEYTDARALGWHMHGHGDDYTIAPDIAAALRGAGERRRARALEELDV